jgi:hypothetical protein
MRRRSEVQTMKGSVKLGALVASLALCLSVSAPAAQEKGQEKRPPVRRDATQLRRALARALGGEFEIVRDELTRRSTYYSGGGFWLVHVRPKRAGQFSLKYVYEYDDPFDKSGEPHARVERTIALGVGPRGCWRRPEHMASRYEPCLGDTIILPIALDAYKTEYAGHTFEFTVHSVAPEAAPAGPEKWEEDLARQQEAGLDKEAVANPSAEHLKYLGRTTHIMPHRAPGYTAVSYATFEAVKPGRFNLSLGASAPGVPPDGHPGGGSVPVIVVERGTPVTWLAAQESVSDHKGRFSSHWGENYLTSPVIMQPGERLTLPFHSFSRRGSKSESKPNERELARNVAPVIHRHPFHIDRDDNYNEWIIDYPPYAIKN